MDNTHCPKCGANYALVGRVHRCVERAVPKSLPLVETTAPEKASSAYRYRDPEKRRAYCRVLAPFQDLSPKEATDFFKWGHSAPGGLR